MIDEMLAQLKGKFPQMVWIAREFSVLDLKKFLGELKENIPENPTKVA
jgi:hypothetical protein